jgi:hypothetical protein
MINLSSAMATTRVYREEIGIAWSQVYQPPDAEPVGLFIV